MNKLYYIANARLPTEKAHGVQLAKMSEALVGSGINLELVLPERDNRIAQSVEIYYNLHRPLNIKRVPARQFSSSWLGFNLSALFFAFSYLKFLFAEKRAGRKGTIYTIDLDNFSFSLVPLLGWPYFVEVHGSKKRHLLNRFFFRHARGIIAVSGGVKDSLVKNFGVSPDKIIVASNGIDPLMFGRPILKASARASLSLPLYSPIILYLGKFYRWKGLQILAEAASKLLAEGVLVYLVGGTPQEFKRATGFNELPKNLICAGHQPYRDVPTWLFAADLLLVLGTKKNRYSYFETSPMKVFEYMAAGRPIIASRTPANSGIVSDKDVFFYEPDNADDLVIKIKEVLASPETAERKVEGARGLIDRFSWEKRAARVIEFIKNSL